MPYEKIETLNRRLHEQYGETNNLPNFRIVFSENEFEERLTDFTDKGVQLLHPEVRLLPKYRQWIHNKHVLERLTEIPFINQQDLPGKKLSYEPLWVFEDPFGQPLYPIWGACRFVLDQVHKQQEEAGVYRKYKDKNLTAEERIIELQGLEQELFGNETDIGDALAQKDAISMAGLDGTKKEH